jgi:PAS domain S-box-containing protein
MATRVWKQLLELREPEELGYRLHQQSVISEFGQSALEALTLDKLLSEAVRLCAEGMRARYCKALEYLADRDIFLVRAGVGWRPGVVGRATLETAIDTPAGRAFRTAHPFLSNDLASERGLRVPKLLVEHGIRRLLSAPIPFSEGHAWGVLTADSPDEGAFDAADCEFMEAMGRLLGVAIQGRLAQQRFEEQAALLRLSHDAIIVWTAANGVELWSEGAAGLYGFTADEAFGRAPAELIRPTYPAPWTDVAKALKTQGGWEGEIRQRRKDGGEVVVLSRLQLVAGPNGAERLMEVNRDITPRKRVEEALRASEQQFRTLAESLPQLAWMADGQGWIYWFNRRWFEYTGTTLEEMQGWGWRKVHHPDHVDRVVERISHAWDTGEPWEDNFPLLGADGRYRWFLSRALPMRDSKGRVTRWFGTNTDITEKQRLEDLQKVLIHEIGHRVKNSLALVSSLLTLQARRLDGTPRKVLEDASSRVHAVARVHEQLSLHGNAQDVDLGPFIQNVAKAIASSAPRHRTIVEAEPAMVSADLAVPMGLLLNELLTNAYKYAYPEGAEGEVRVDGARIEDNRYRLEVADFGRGLPPGFDIAKARDSLGTRVITSLSAQLEGELGTDSAGPGARFILTFPLKARRV